MFDTVKLLKFCTRPDQCLFAGIKKEVLWVFVTPDGLQENQGGTSVAEVLRDGGVASGDCVNPWRVFAVDRVCT